MRWVEKYEKEGEIKRENYFSMMKFRLQKLDGLTHKELKNNIKKSLKIYQKKI